MCENLKLNVGYILFAKNTIVLIIWNTLIFGVFYFLLCPFFWNDWPMEGSVLSFLKAEWKVSDTGSAHWASSFTTARFKSRLVFLFLLIYSKPCLLQLPRPYSFKKIPWPPLDYLLWRRSGRFCESGSHAQIPYLQQCKVKSRNQGT